MHSCISIRGCLSVHPSVPALIRPSVRPLLSHTRVEILRKGLSGPNLNKIASGTWNCAIWMVIKRQVRKQIARTHLMSELCQTCFPYFEKCFWSCWINFDVSPDHGNPNPNWQFKKSWLHFNDAADCSWPWSAGVFFTYFGFKNSFDHVELILMFYLTMETPTDHPYNSGRVDYILMVQLTMVSWGFFHITALKTVRSGWIDFDVSPDHGNPNGPTKPFRKSRLHFNGAAEHGQLGLFSQYGFKNSLSSCWIDFDVSPDHGKPNWPFTQFKKSRLHFNGAAEHGQLGLFSQYGFKNSLSSCWIDFDVSPDHGKPNWPFTQFKKSRLHFNVAADHGQLGFFLIFWL